MNEELCHLQIIILTYSDQTTTVSKTNIIDDTALANDPGSSNLKSQSQL